MYSARLARLVQDGMAVAGLQTLLFMDSNQFPLNVGLTAQNSPLKVATRSPGPECGAIMVTVLERLEIPPGCP